MPGLRHFDMTYNRLRLDYLSAPLTVLVSRVSNRDRSQEDRSRLDEPSRAMSEGRLKQNFIGIGVGNCVPGWVGQVQYRKIQSEDR